MEIKDINRPGRELTRALEDIGTATVSSEPSRMGLRNCHIQGPRSLTPGRAAAGPALTLQCMPKREDLYSGDEYDNPDLQLHRHVMYPAQAGDMIVDARGDTSSGIFGETMMTFFAGHGGAEGVINGCIRDSGPASKLDVGIWVNGVIPNCHAQTNIVPHAVNVPIACGGVFAMPCDIVVADEDGAVIVPIALAPRLLEAAGEHAEWEEFSRLRLSQGADLEKYYPLSDEVYDEYLARRNLQAGGSTSSSTRRQTIEEGNVTGIGRQPHAHQSDLRRQQRMDLMNWTSAKTTIPNDWAYHGQ